MQRNAAYDFDDRTVNEGLLGSVILPVSGLADRPGVECFGILENRLGGDAVDPVLHLLVEDANTSVGDGPPREVARVDPVGGPLLVDMEKDGVIHRIRDVPSRGSVER
jgi:hypothetical protein